MKDTFRGNYCRLGFHALNGMKRIHLRNCNGFLVCIFLVQPFDSVSIVSLETILSHRYACSIIWIRLPHVSSKTAIVMSPIFVGFMVNLTPSSTSLSYSL